MSVCLLVLIWIQSRHLNRSVHFAVETSRQDDFDRLKIIGNDRVFEESVGFDQNVLNPEMSAAKARVVRKKAKSLPGLQALTGAGEGRCNFCEFWAFGVLFFFAGAYIAGLGLYGCIVLFSFFYFA